MDPLPAHDLPRRLEAAATLLVESRALLTAREVDGEPPAPVVGSDWVSFLADLDDARLDDLEARGQLADWAGAPPSLLELVARARDLTALPPTLDAVELGPHRRREGARKRAQVAAFSRVVVPLAALASRVVDVGAGHGHLTRAVAERSPAEVVGLERDAGLATRARSLGGAPEFVVTDVLADGLSLRSSDCAIGLHACGELSDVIVERAASVGASLALVGCCLQKRRQPTRAPLVRDVPWGESLTLPREILGLSNLTARDRGVEASRAENLAARERRLAVWRLLSAHGPIRPGTELLGLNRRSAQAELRALAERVFAHRGLPSPGEPELSDAAEWARERHGRARRFALPRTLLARVLEVFVLLDRARYLELRGYRVGVGELFPAEVSARNLVLWARRH